ncbi:MAG: hypothetical protein ACJ8LG_04770 [Massilia sp.]
MANATGKRKNDLPAEPAVQRIALDFSKPRLAAEVPESLTLSATAEMAIALAPPGIQHELLQLISSVDAQPLPATPGLFGAKSTSGYRVLFKLNDGKREVIEVFSPSQLERFALQKANG